MAVFVEGRLRRRRCAAVAGFAAALLAACQGLRPRPAAFAQPSRRGALLGAWLPLAAAQASPAAAFENALPAATGPPKMGGSIRPGDLGLDIRVLRRKGSKLVKTEVPALKGCEGRAAACLSTTDDAKDPKQVTKLEPWRVPAGADPKEAFGQLIQVLKKYPPGQGGIDERGFRLVEVKSGYVYGQFQSFEGAIDDVEFAVAGDGSVLVRSGGRKYNNVLTGIDDLPDNCSNGKRLNFVAAKLREAGWSAPEVTSETHAYYFAKRSNEMPAAAR
mmetsp:Transcript_78892/g.170499  ORF Transcript_78892/g.170499 Transcript_78892/m.170499 type:complete len:274 (+) Transcript_78892:48-869(+)